MKNIKAVIAGSVFVFVIMLIVQLLFLFAAIAYNSLAADYPFLKEIAFIFRYLVGLPVMILVMAMGGYIAASVAGETAIVKLWLNCFVVGLITIGTMMYSALENAELTITGFVVIVLTLISTSAGGFYWRGAVVNQETIDL